MRKGTLIIIIILYCMSLHGCTKEYNGGTLDEDIMSMYSDDINDFKNAITLIDIDEKMKVDDLKVQIINLSRYQFRDNSYGLEVGLQVKHTGEGNEAFSEVIDIGATDNELNTIYSKDNHNDGLMGYQDYKEVTIRAGETVYAECLFNTSSNNPHYDSIRLFVLIGEELFEVDEFEAVLEHWDD